MNSENNASSPWLSDIALHKSSRHRRDLQYISMISNTVAAAYDVPISDLLAASRGSARISQARQIAMYLTHVLGGIPLHATGFAFGRDRTTVAHACAVVENRRDDPRFNRTMDLLEGIIRRLQVVTVHGTGPRHCSKTD